MTIVETHIAAQRDRQPDLTSSAASGTRSRWRIARMISAVGLLSLGVYLYSQGHLAPDHLRLFGASLPAWLFLIAYLVLPLFGFPISVALLASGLKFGFGKSVAIAAVGMGFHTLIAWQITHGYFHQRMELWLSRTRFRLPQIPDQHQIWFTCLFVTLPGLPYAVKLYSLALTNLPFRRYLIIVWFCHVVNSVFFIGFGAAAGQLNSKLLIGFGMLLVILVALTNRLKKLMVDTT